MNGNEQLDNDIGINKLPLDAFGQFDEPIDQDDQWIRTAKRKDQVVALRAWFLARYCDPATILSKRFFGIVDQQVIQEVVDELRGKLGNLRD